MVIIKKRMKNILKKLDNNVNSDDKIITIKNQIMMIKIMTIKIITIKNQIMMMKIMTIKIMMIKMIMIKIMMMIVLKNVNLKIVIE